MSYVAVLPYAHFSDYDECLATLLLTHYDLDNTEHNRGVAGSWNLGIDQMRKEYADWLIILSASMRFGQAGGLDILDVLEDAPPNVIYLADETGGPLGTEGFAYHCVGIHREVVEKVGYFDPNFYPIYFEDTDYTLRCKKAGYWPFALGPIDAKTMGYGRGVQLAGINAPAEPNIAYFATKWGVHPNAVAQLGSYEHPFNDFDNSIKFFPPARGRVWDQ